MLSHLSIEWQKAKNKQIKHRYPSSVVKYISTPQWRAKYALYFTVLSRHLALTIPLSYSFLPFLSISCAILNIYISGFNSLVLVLFLLPGDRCCSSTWLHFKASSPHTALKVGRSTGNLFFPPYMFRSPPTPTPSCPGSPGASKTSGPVLGQRQAPCQAPLRLSPIQPPVSSILNTSNPPLPSPQISPPQPLPKSHPPTDKNPHMYLSI